MDGLPTEKLGCRPFLMIVSSIGVAMVSMPNPSRTDTTILTTTVIGWYGC
jgi:hypothetical protein